MHIGPVCVVGCTASGKTGLAIELASILERLSGQKSVAISVDSIQVILTYIFFNILLILQKKV